jgi:hypothetical protein
MEWRTALDCPEGVPGLIMTLHTFGEYLDFHPHRPDHAPASSMLHRNRPKTGKTFRLILWSSSGSVRQ